MSTNRQGGELRMERSFDDGPAAGAAPARPRRDPTDPAGATALYPPREEPILWARIARLRFYKLTVSKWRSASGEATENSARHFLHSRPSRHTHA
jgi:hypothetical protein